jgi:DNA-directed RNA polymerase specialized sigma24 family protein
MSVDEGTGGLVRAALGGDREAFGLLVERSWHRLVRLALSVVGELEAEDAVQDGLVASRRRRGARDRSGGRDLGGGTAAGT